MVQTQSILDQLAMSLAPDFSVQPLPIADAPIFLAVGWPNREGVTGLKPRLPAGRGTTLQQALLSASAEALELRAGLAQNHRNEIAALVQQNGEDVVVAIDVLRGDSRYLPARDVYLDYPVSTDQTGADSTGCAVGVNRDQAIMYGLLECIERDATALWWYGQTVQPVIPLELIDDLQPRLYWWLLERDRRTFLLNLANDNGVPIVVAVSHAPDGTGVAIGASARFDQKIAALGAITEMIQTETALKMALSVNDPEALSWVQTASASTIKALQPGEAVLPMEHESDMDSLLQALAYGDHTALAVELSLPEDPLPTMRVLVPGFCAMGRRINWERLQQQTGIGQDALHFTKWHLPEPF